MQQDDKVHELSWPNGHGVFYEYCVKCKTTTCSRMHRYFTYEGYLYYLMLRNNRLSGSKEDLIWAAEAAELEFPGAIKIVPVGICIVCSSTSCRRPHRRYTREGYVKYQIEIMDVQRWEAIDRANEEYRKYGGMWFGYPFAPGYGPTGPPPPSDAPPPQDGGGGAGGASRPNFQPPPNFGGPAGPGAGFEGGGGGFEGGGGGPHGRGGPGQPLPPPPPNSGGGGGRGPVSGGPYGPKNGKPYAAFASPEYMNAANNYTRCWNEKIAGRDPSSREFDLLREDLYQQWFEETGEDPPINKMPWETSHYNSRRRFGGHDPGVGGGMGGRMNARMGPGGPSVNMGGMGGMPNMNVSGDFGSVGMDMPGMNFSGGVGGGGGGSGFMNGMQGGNGGFSLNLNGTNIHFNGGDGGGLNNEPPLPPPQRHQRPKDGTPLYAEMTRAYKNRWNMESADMPDSYLEVLAVKFAWFWELDAGERPSKYEMPWNNWLAVNLGGRRRLRPAECDAYDFRNRSPSPTHYRRTRSPAHLDDAKAFRSSRAKYDSRFCKEIEDKDLAEMRRVKRRLKAEFERVWPDRSKDAKMAWDVIPDDDEPEKSTSADRGDGPSVAFNSSQDDFNKRFYAAIKTAGTAEVSRVKKKLKAEFEAMWPDRAKTASMAWDVFADEEEPEDTRKHTASSVEEYERKRAAKKEKKKKSSGRKRSKSRGRRRSYDLSDNDDRKRSSKKEKKKSSKRKSSPQGSGDDSDGARGRSRVSRDDESKKKKKDDKKIPKKKRPSSHFTDCSTCESRSRERRENYVDPYYMYSERPPSPKRREKPRPSHFPPGAGDSAYEAVRLVFENHWKKKTAGESSEFIREFAAKMQKRWENEIGDEGKGESMPWHKNNIHRPDYPEFRHVAHPTLSTSEILARWKETGEKEGTKKIEGGRTVHVPVTIKGHKTTAVLDSGNCNYSMISDDVVRMLGLARTEIPYPLRMGDVAGDETLLREVATFSISVNGYVDEYFQAYINKDMVEDLNIGYTWMQKNQVVIDAEKDEVHFSSAGQAIQANPEQHPDSRPSKTSTLQQLPPPIKSFYQLSGSQIGVKRSRSRRGRLGLKSVAHRELDNKDILKRWEQTGEQDEVPTGGTLLIPGLIDGHAITACLDTGNQSISAISDSLVKRLGLPRTEIPYFFRGTGVTGGGAKRCNEISTFTVNLNGFTEEHHQAYIIKDLATDLLIGYPWLKKQRAMIDTAEEHIYFQDAKFTIQGNPAVHDPPTGTPPQTSAPQRQPSAQAPSMPKPSAPNPPSGKPNNIVSSPPANPFVPASGILPLPKMTGDKEWLEGKAKCEASWADVAKTLTDPKKFQNQARVFQVTIESAFGERAKNEEWPWTPWLYIDNPEMAEKMREERRWDREKADLDAGGLGEPISLAKKPEPTPEQERAAQKAPAVQQKSTPAQELKATQNRKSVGNERNDNPTNNSKPVAGGRASPPAIDNRYRPQVAARKPSYDDTRPVISQRSTRSYAERARRLALPNSRQAIPDHQWEDLGLRAVYNEAFLRHIEDKFSNERERLTRKYRDAWANQMRSDGKEQQTNNRVMMWGDVFEDWCPDDAYGRPPDTGNRAPPRDKYDGPGLKRSNTTQDRHGGGNSRRPERRNSVRSIGSSKGKGRGKKQNGKDCTVQ